MGLLMRSQSVVREYKAEHLRASLNLFVYFLAPVPGGPSDI
jgi:hypothetical protein